MTRPPAEEEVLDAVTNETTRWNCESNWNTPQKSTGKRILPKMFGKKKKKKENVAKSATIEFT